MQIQFQVKGVEKTILKMRTLNENVLNEVDTAVKRGAILVQKKAREYLAGQHGHPRHWITGNLARGIKYKTVRKFVTDEILGIIGTDVPYSVYIEALPDGGFLRPALTTQATEIVGYLKSEMQRILRDVS